VASAIEASPAAAGHKARRRELTQSRYPVRRLVAGLTSFQGSILRLDICCADHLPPFLGFI
jgi:hypothetical protein